jgi:hypothetical protein
VDTEYDELASALQIDDNDGIEVAALNIDQVLRLASAGLPKDTNGLLLGMLEETRALRKELVIGYDVSDWLLVRNRLTRSSV